MKSVFKILVPYFLLISTLNGRAQSESYLQPFSNLLSINSSFAGYNDNTSFRTGNQFYSINEDKAYNLFYATYDTYSSKLKGGIGFTFQHGIIGAQNISTTELGFSYARFRKKTQNGQFIGSINLNALIATKQWYAYIMDQFLLKADDTPSAPGKKFTRYYILKPGGSFLFDTRSVLFGLSATVPLQYSMASDGDGTQVTDKFPLSASFYLAKKMAGNHKGLKSSPYQINPELIVFYNEEYIVSRIHLKVEKVDKSYGAFIQNDFTNNIHCLGATIGYRNRNTRINLNAGAGIPGISDDIGAIIELSLNIVVPQVYYSKIKPWAPKRK